MILYMHWTVMSFLFSVETFTNHQSVSALAPDYTYHQQRQVMGRLQRLRHSPLAPPHHHLPRCQCPTSVGSRRDAPSDVDIRRERRATPWRNACSASASMTQPSRLVERSWDRVVNGPARSRPMCSSRGETCSQTGVQTFSSTFHISLSLWTKVYSALHWIVLKWIENLCTFEISGYTERFNQANQQITIKFFIERITWVKQLFTERVA